MKGRELDQEREIMSNSGTESERAAQDRGWYQDRQRALILISVIMSLKV